MQPPISIEVLPDFVIEYILSYLSPYTDLKQCMLVNKCWYQYVQEVVRKMHRDFHNAVCNMSVQWSTVEAAPGPTITKRYSHSACVMENSMYVFGGCTTANTTFNDLWRLDLNSRCWIRPLATGTYPPPKACATLVNYCDNLILFGGWTHTAPTPHHQVWRVFNEIHVYNIIANRWTQITSATPCPPVAGHSATVHGDYMVVFGGVHKQVDEGPFQSSSDVWTLDLKSYKWQKQNIAESSSTPAPRYGPSQVYIDEKHLLIMGGSAVSKALLNDIWLLKMNGGPGGIWEWEQVEVRGKENGAPQIAFHPPCKVGNQVVILSKSLRARPAPSVLSYIIKAPSRIWVPPRVDDNSNKRPTPDIDPCVNGKRGTLRRPQSQPQQQVHPPPNPSDRSSWRHNRPQLESHEDKLSGQNLVEGARRRRKRYLEQLDLMEERLKELRSSRLRQNYSNCRRPMCLYVLDITNVVESQWATWRPLKNHCHSAPDEMILYSLVMGKGELIMFGGIQKDLNSKQQEGDTVPEIVSNSLHFMAAERFII